MRQSERGTAVFFSEKNASQQQRVYTVRAERGDKKSRNRVEFLFSSPI